MDIVGIAAIVTGGGSDPGGATAARLANPMLNGETIRLDGAIRMAVK